jgi:1,5-anhydro-D-fructose reductase (1,5-anhydro-D-mannitol-forming)
MAGDQVLGVAMLSFAHVHAHGYARQVVENPRTRMVVVWDEDPARGREAAARYGVPFEPDLDRALAYPEVRGVVCDAPSRLHTEVLVRAAQAGKHLFTEKVLALTVAECDQILAAARAAGVHLVVSMPQLCDPATRWAKQALDEGRFGQVTLVRTRIGHSAALDRWFPPDSWFGDPALAGGGALMDLGCHPVYRIRYLMGEPRACMARLTNLTGSYRVDDNAVVLLEFQGGALGVVEASWVQRGGPEGIAIYGTKGWALIGYPGAPVQCGGEAFTGEHGGVLQPGRLPAAWRSPFQQWVDAVLDGVEPDIRPEWGRHLTEIMQAAYRSDRERREVSWPIL